MNGILGFPSPNHDDMIDAGDYNNNELDSGYNEADTIPSHECPPINCGSPCCYAIIGKKSFTGCLYFSKPELLPFVTTFQKFNE